MITVQVCAAWSDRVLRAALQLSEGSTIAAARNHPALDAALRECWGQAPVVAVFGEIRGPDHVLGDGDRIELLRPLLADPKEARRERAKLRATQAKPTLQVRKRAKTPSV